MFECSHLAEFNDFMKNVLLDICAKSTSGLVNQLDFGKICIFGVLKSDRYINFYFLNIKIAYTLFASSSLYICSHLESDIGSQLFDSFNISTSYYALVFLGSREILLSVRKVILKGGILLLGFSVSSIISEYSVDKESI
jgi:hypothetical protein